MLEYALIQHDSKMGRKKISKQQHDNLAGSAIIAKAGMRVFYEFLAIARGRGKICSPKPNLSIAETRSGFSLAKTRRVFFLGIRITLQALRVRRF